LFPFFYDAGKASKAPVPELTAKAKEAKTCVESKAYMVTQHMHLLDLWRNDAVRDENRFFKGIGGKVYYTSLQATCLNCHSNKDKFCDQCHNYMAVVPYCWDCHFAPKESK
jgi:hypothetical protein